MYLLIKKDQLMTYEMANSLYTKYLWWQPFMSIEHFVIDLITRKVNRKYEQCLRVLEYGSS